MCGVEYNALCAHAHFILLLTLAAEPGGISAAAPTNSYDKSLHVLASH